MIARQKPVIVAVAQSARMLVQMAVKLGFAVVAVDCYGDCDTRKLATELCLVDSLAAADLWPTMDELADRYPSASLLYGSGFELHPDSLQGLARRWRLLGNSPSLFAAMLDKCCFFSRLDSLGIEYPESRLNPPSDAGDWLMKPMSGAGGVGIRQYETEDVASDGYYWQRLMPGEVASALFVADGRRAKILGFNRQWTMQANPQAPYLFSGVQNGFGINLSHRRQVAIWLERLLSDYPLLGLGSIDFIVGSDKCYLLEVNARIPASAQLYGKSALSLHLQACLQGVGKHKRLRIKPSGIQLVYAEKQICVPTQIEWPVWTVDLPLSGAIIERGQPICSIIAGGKNAAQVRSRLHLRQQLIETLLNSRN